MESSHRAYPCLVHWLHLDGDLLVVSSLTRRSAARLADRGNAAPLDAELGFRARRAWQSASARGSCAGAPARLAAEQRRYRSSCEGVAPVDGAMSGRAHAGRAFDLRITF